MAGQRRDNLVGDGFDIERFGQCRHASILSEVLEGANGYKSASRAHVRSWPITSDIALEPNVGFRDTADIVRSEHEADR
jgi:hypothetical protein